jgi:hypothetical protein
MALVVREVTLTFAAGEPADAWVAANEPVGLVAGPIRWQLVVHRPGSSQVRLIQGFTDLAGAADWRGTELPDLAGAEAMSVTLADALAYVSGNDPQHEGPGRVWRPIEDLAGAPDA